jgi:hypothetical protein
MKHGVKLILQLFCSTVDTIYINTSRENSGAQQLILSTKKEKKKLQLAQLPKENEIQRPIPLTRILTEKSH